MRSQRLEVDADGHGAGAVQTGAMLLIGAGLWLLSRPWTFNETDTQLYSLMAMASLDPSRFGPDLFLKFGSQDSFSIFSPIYGLAIRALGLAGANAVLLLAGGSVWLSGGWRLCRRFAPDFAMASLAFLALASLRVLYAGYGVLYPGEAVLTSRIFAEGFSLLAFCALIDRRWWLGGAAMLLAAALHPLMVVAPFAVVFLVLATYEKRLFWLIPIGVVAAFGLAFIGIAPFDRIFERMDPAWLAEVKRQNGFVFPLTWGQRDWLRLACQLVCVITAGCTQSGWRRWGLLFAALISILGVTASVVGGDLLENVLIIQLQLWRTAWLTAIGAVIGAALLIRPERGVAGWLAAALFALGLVISDQRLALFAAVAGAGIVALRRPLPRMAALGILSCLAIALISTAMWWSVLIIARARLVATGLDLPTWLPLRIGFAWLFVPAAWLAARRLPRTAVALAAAACLLSLVTWDQRLPWVRYITSGAVPPTAATAPVLWGPWTENSWFLLRQPSYIGMQQAAGLLFSKEQSLAWRSRLDNVRGVLPDDTWTASFGGTRTCEVILHRTTASELKAMCASSDGPGSVILRSPVEGLAPKAVFGVPVPQTTFCLQNNKLKQDKVKTFYRYDCADQR